MDLKNTAIGGIALGLAVVVWQGIAAAAGLNAIFPLVATLLELVILVGALAQTRTQQSYGTQVASGSAMAAISLVFIGPGALAVGAPMADLIAGVVGTLVSGIVIALIASIWLRAKPAPQGD